MTRTQMVESMKKLLWPEATGSLKDGPFDSWYFPLTQGQIDDLLKFYRGRRELSQYIEDAWDCDDFSEEFTYLARVWAMRNFPEAEVCPAVGSAFARVSGLYEMFSRPVWGRVAHALNVILRDDGQWFFIEPQTLKLQKIEGPCYEKVIDVERIQI